MNLHEAFQLLWGNGEESRRTWSPRIFVVDDVGGWGFVLRFHCQRGFSGGPLMRNDVSGGFLQMVSVNE